MALLEIKEPQTYVPKPMKRAVGIDLGTTHSLVACDIDGKIHVLADEAGETLIPSVVRFLPDNQVDVGFKAKEALAYDPHNTIVSVKRSLDKLVIKTPTREVSPIEVSKHILSKMLEIARQVDHSIVDAVITVPAYFDETQRQATKQAARLAGINVLRLLNEPTAAALAYGLEREARGYCLIYDLGGGTFDVSLLQLNQGVFEVLATGGDTALGGDDFDALLARKMLKEANLTEEQVNFPQFLMQARAIKETLSQEEAHGAISRKDFDALIQPLVDRTLSICAQVLKDAKIEKSEIAHVVLVGGSTRVKLVQKEVAQFFERTPLKEIDPDKVVAMGAAIQASLLSGMRRCPMLLLDVIPLSLGIEMMGGVVEKLLMRNTPIPAIATERFTTYQDGQTGFSLHIVQGERELAKDCRSLATFDLTGLPAMPAGAVKIEVCFRVDADGLLCVEAKELKTQKQTHIEVKPTYGLSEKTISDLIEDSIANAEIDVRLRKLQEKTNQAQQLITMLTKALTEEGHLLSEAALAKITKGKEAIEKALLLQEAKAITQAMQAIEEDLQAFLQLRMQSTLQNTIFGKSLSEVEERLS